MKKSARAPRRAAAVTAYYVASTHWDREWYEPFQHYRFRLVDVLDGVIDLMERDPEYRSYQLDGQAIVLEDYLEIRPEKRPRLQALIAAGRILAGPWYVLPDEFLVCGESLVRNLLRGHQVAGAFGPPMKVGFVCDLFGHNSQLPQIFRGFGIDAAVVWRGTNAYTTPGVFRWHAADGSEVLAYAFEDRGYGQYWVEVRDRNRVGMKKLNLAPALEGFRRCVEIERQRTPGKAVLLFDGIDHVWAEPATTALLQMARAPGLKVVHGSLPEFFDAVRRQNLDLQTLTGELRESGHSPNTWLIPGVLSSRNDLKQRNAACENRLLHWAEPFGVLADLVGEEYPAEYLKRAWRYLLTNHPHDSICGCSIDQVHRDMQYRFDQCRLIADRATHMSLRAIADRMPLPKLDGEEDFVVTLFNPTSDARDGILDFPLYFKRDTQYRWQEWFGYEPIVGFRLFTPEGGEVPYQRLDVQKVEPYKRYDRVEGYQGDKRERVRVAAKLAIPGHGWTTLVCKPTKQRTRSAGSQLVDDHTMQNEHLRVSINPNGSVDITDRAAHQTYWNALLFEDRADIGDGWFHGTAVNDEWFTSAGAAADIALVHDGFALTTFRVRVTLNVPERFELDQEIMRRSPRLVPLVITSWITLRAGQGCLEVRTEIENNATDHRLRVLIPTHIAAQTYFADGPFDVIERDIALPADSHLRAEPEVETKPQYSFTAVSDGQRGLAVISTGQPESAVRDLPERPIALTLFRGFPRTVTHEGERDGQLLGRRTHRYWIYPHTGPLPIAEILRLGQQLAAGIECVYTAPPRYRLLPRRPLLPLTGSWLTLSDGPLVLSACKQAEDGQAVILRLFNPTAEDVTQKVQFAAAIESAYLADMLEQPTAALFTEHSSLTLNARPKQILTLRVRLKPLPPLELEKPAVRAARGQSPRGGAARRKAAGKTRRR